MKYLRIALGIIGATILGPGLLGLAFLALRCDDMPNYRNPFFPHPPTGPMPVINPDRTRNEGVRRRILIGNTIQLDPGVDGVGGGVVATFPLIAYSEPGKPSQALSLQFSMRSVEDAGKGSTGVWPLIAAGNRLVLQAWIRWGTDGADQQAIVDIGHGSTINVHGNVVYVDVINMSTAAGAAVGKYNIAGSVAEGSADATFPTCTTIRSGVAGPGVNTFFVHAFARQIDFYREDIANAYTINILASDGTTLSVHTIAANANLNRPIILPAPAARVEAISGGAGGKIQLIELLDL